MSPDVPGQPASSESLIEIRPVRPTGKLDIVERWTVDHWRMTADTGNGTLTLSGDRYPRRRSSVFPLATAGRADGVSMVCLATYRWEVQPRLGAIWRMLLLDREGRLVGAGFSRPHPQVLRLFPPEVFEPLTAAGIRVASEWYDSPRALEDAHPGAVRKVALTATRGKLAAIGLTTALLIFIAVGVAVYLTR